jgi:hypothetical protein
MADSLRSVASVVLSMVDEIAPTIADVADGTRRSPARATSATRPAWARISAEMATAIDLDARVAR